MSELYLGMISGTSMDGVDAVLVEFEDHACRVLDATTTPYSAPLLQDLRGIVEVPRTSLRDLGSLDHRIGKFFATCARELIARAGFDADDVRAIGHHGQTIFHSPGGDAPFSMQIGDPNVVAADTGICTVADFRRLDMALGGQGAPLVPAFHAWCFGAQTEARAVVNIGGIGNITTLEPDRPVLGFDTGPGNTLLDLWVRRHQALDYDRNGEWAASGATDPDLLETLLAEPYFDAPPPKSTGRELFNMDWLGQRLAHHAATRPADVQATLSDLTAVTIARSIERVLPSCRRLIVCGGGAHNADLMARLQRASGKHVGTTAEYGIAPDWVEGAAFAWLARARLRGDAGNVPTVTGARRSAILGGVYSTATPTHS
jgi:anhydro-N-acetylmuramic acid kinase